jgi:hypothetical protein
MANNIIQSHRENAKGGAHVHMKRVLEPEFFLN